MKVEARFFGPVSAAGNRTGQKRSEAKRNETKRNETKRNETRAQNITKGLLFLLLSFETLRSNFRDILQESV
jgi:hypothetical protein